MNLFGKKKPKYKSKIYVESVAYALGIDEEREEDLLEKADELLNKHETISIVLDKLYSFAKNDAEKKYVCYIVGIKNLTQGNKAVSMIIEPIIRHALEEGIIEVEQSGDKLIVKPKSKGTCISTSENTMYG